MRELIRNLLFKIHKFGMYIIPFMWIYDLKFLFLYAIIILSWKIRSNKCLISEIEYSIFGSTFMGNGPKYYVPYKHRKVLYINTALAGLLYLKQFI